MTVLDEFYAGYLHYTVAFRIWTDTCRQLADCKGTLDERQALVDETLRLSMCVADNIVEADLDTVRRLMRHSDITTTLRCYVHADPSKMHAAQDGLSAIMRGTIRAE